MKKGIAAFLMILLLEQYSACAAVIDHVDVDQDNSTVSITGSLPVAKAKQRVGILLLKKDITPEQFMQASDVQRAEMIAQILQTETDADGGYAVTALLSEPTGNYYVRVGYGLKNQARGEQFHFLSVRDLEAVFAELNTVKDADQLRELIEPYLSYLGLDTALYEVSQDKTEVCRLILIERDLLPGKAFGQYGDFADVFYHCAYMQAMAAAKTAAAVLELMGANMARYETLAIYPTWQRLDADGKLAAAEVLANTASFASVAQMDEAFSEAVVLETVARVVSHGDIAVVLAENAQLIGFDKAQYDALTREQKAEVHKAVAGKRYASLASLKSALHTAMGSSGQTGGGSKRPGSSGGSGGSAKPMTGSLTSPVQTQNPVNQYVPFADMDTAAWAQDCVQYFHQHKLIDGDGNGNFRPNDAITRAEFVKLLVNCFSLRDHGAQAAFDDVSADDWFYPYVASAVSAGILQGVSEREFAPQDNLSREQMAVILDRMTGYLELPLSVEQQRFSDEGEVSGYARESVARMGAAGLMRGMGDGRFCPQQTTTRAQACAALYQMVTRGGPEK